jgi:hypothetical protein
MNYPTEAAEAATRTHPAHGDRGPRRRLRRDQIADRHHRAARTLGLLLTAADAQLWIEGARVWAARLSPEERRNLVLSAGLSLPPDAFADVADEVLAASPDPAGHPQPTLHDPIEEAVWWTEVARPDELAAYAMACSVAMAAPDRQAFLAWARARRGGEV